MKKYKTPIIVGVIIIVALVAAFFAGGDNSTVKPQDGNPNTQRVLPNEENRGNDTSVSKDENKSDNIKETDDAAISEEENRDSTNAKAETDRQNNSGVIENHEKESPEQKQQDIDYSKEHGMNIDSQTGTDEYKTEPVPEGKPVPVEPQNSEITDKEMTCVLSVRCDTILNNLSKFNSDKMDILPQEGVIFAEREVTFYEGESVFNVTLREMKKNKIHMEFVNTPIYNSAYIEGIGNIYEYDCGELSGWMYSVNGWFPNYGCSRYELKQGDKIEWQYTCDLGADVGGYTESGGGQRDE
ncbi:MAG: DUF4430 domain-containing protein [Clostridiales bacterium]|jgi:hypothetical protein|nr:DUF4430 domain-containing protein [Clostridiales bacterium]